MTTGISSVISCAYSTVTISGSTMVFRSKTKLSLCKAPSPNNDIKESLLPGRAELRPVADTFYDRLDGAEASNMKQASEQTLPFPRKAEHRLWH